MVSTTFYFVFQVVLILTWFYHDAMLLEVDVILINVLSDILLFIKTEKHQK